jgi:uncharacterized membrane protein SirB2
MSKDTRLKAASLALFVVLAVGHTWPLASAPGTWSRNDNDDTVLHEWTIAWVSHAVVHQPQHLFDANIFYPERNTLAYSDHLFPQSMMAAPLLWAGGSPVLAYNLLLIAGFALTGWATSLVVHRWTESWLAGILSGSLMAFNAFTLTRLPQVQDQHFEFFPLTLIALDRLLAEPRAKHSLQLAGWFILQALACGYFLAFTSISLAAAAFVRPEPWLTPRLRSLAGYVLLAAGVAGVVLLPFLIPYFEVSRDVGLKRGLPEVARFSAHWSTYLTTGGRLHYAWWSRRFFRGDALFPGVVGTVLALAAIVTGAAVRDLRARMALATGVVAFAFSFGPAFPPYEWLYSVFPLLTGIRGAVRFGQFFLAAIAILAGFGLARVQQRLRRGGLALCVALIVVVHVEALRAPFVYTPYRGLPPIWDSLKGAGTNAVLVCFPFYGPLNIHANTRYMLVSTRFWRPLLNGYSGFAPPSYFDNYNALALFPDRASIQYLRDRGVTHVAVEGQDMPRGSRISPSCNCGRPTEACGFID